MMLTSDDQALPEEIRMMRDACRAYVDDVVIPFIRDNWQAEWNMSPGERLPRSILEKADEVGIRTLGIPEEFGGICVDPAHEITTYSVLAEELARGDSGLADKMVQTWKISLLLRSLAPRHLQEHWFPKIVKDPGFLMAHCLTEPRGASDRWLPYNVPETAMQTRAVLDGDEWVINGRKQFISNGYDASLYIVYANTRRGVGMLQGTSSFIVPRGTPGFSVTKCNETMGGRFMNNGELVFEDCRVPKDHVLMQDDALAKAGLYLRPSKVIAASKSLGVGMAAFERTARYVQEYVQGGKILIKHQAVAIRLADMATKLATVRALLREATRAVDARREDADVLCSMAKIVAATEVFRVATDAMELHGGNGVMLEFGIEKLFRDAANHLHPDGTIDITRFRIVKAMFPDTAGVYAGPEA